MTTEELEKIVSRHEMQRLELKEGFNVESIETACAFANAGGGFIVIGVDDHGVPSKYELRGESLRDYENKISTATEPCVAVDAEKVLFGGREVVVLRVMENPLKPVAYKGRCFIRKGSVNHQMTPAEIAECHLRSTGGSMDAVFVPGVTKDDLDMEAVRRYMRRSVAKGRRVYGENDDPWEVLVKLEWVKSESEITRAAYLLFAKDPQRKFSQAIIHAGAFKAGGVEILDAHDFKGNIQDQVDEAVTFIKRNIRCAIVNTPGKVDHDSVWDYPIEALRESLANAVCHRDYGSPHDIQLRIYDDSVAISSPGQLPFDMPMELLLSPMHASRPRNRLIAQALYDMGVIEHYGRGIKRIKEECDRNGNPYPDWTDRPGEFLTIYKVRGSQGTEGCAGEAATQTTQGSTQTTQSAAQTTQTSDPRHSEMTEAQMKIVAYLKEHPSASRREITGSSGVGISEDGVKYNLARLQELKIIKRVGPDYGGHWEVQGY